MHRTGPHPAVAHGLRAALVVLSVLSVPFVPLLPARAGGPSPAGAETIELVRDRHGVVHVFASSDEGAMFGAGWAAARDRMYQMHRTRRTVQGRLAELLGLKTAPGGKTTLDSDKDFRRRRVYANCQAVVTQLDEPTRTLLAAYADGVNRWLADHPGELSPLFGGAVPEPWTPADCIAVWDRVTDWFGGGVDAAEAKTLHDLEALGGDCAAWAAQQPPVVIDEAAAVMQQDETPPATLAAICAYAASIGHPCPPAPGSGPLSSPAAWSPRDYPTMSHAWVVGGSALAGGSTALVSDPQTAVNAPSIWYETHVRGATFDARGLAFAGCPGLLVGFSRDLAWGVTSLGIDLSDTWRLTVDAGRTAYLLDGAWHPIHTREDTILVLQPGGGTTRVPFTVRWTDRGPVVTEVMQNVLPGEEYVASAIPWSDASAHSVSAALALLSATDLAGFQQALGGWRAPSIHVVCGDKDGALGYYMTAAVPVRDAGFCLAGRAAGDGSKSSAYWQGTVPLEIRPHVVKPAGGVLYSANHVPVGAWYPIPLLLGTGGSQHGTRGWRLDERLVTDAPPTFLPNQVRDVHDDDVNPAFREIVRAGVHLRDQTHTPPVTLSANALAALAVLDDWLAAGAHSHLAEPAYAGAHGMNLMFRVQNWPALVTLWGGNNLSHLLKDVKARLDAHTPQSPATFTPNEIAFLDFALASGWQDATGKYGAFANWQAGAAAALGSRVVPYFQTLENFGSLDPLHDFTVSGITVPDGNTLRSQWGQSMTLFANLEQPDRSLALHPPGQSEQPDAPYFDVEVASWVSGDLRPAPLSRGAVLTMADDVDSLEFAGVVGAGGTDGGAAVAWSRPAPNPSAGEVVFGFTLGAPGPATLEVFDVRGRRVLARHWPSLAAGPHAPRWDGRDARGTRVAPGVLLLRLTAGGRVIHDRVVRLAADGP